ncbi:MAG: hypothetical protein HND47_15615 [Chloroflexi bacterium]|nr:hypothetical protein [Chloroflexota bacterium]
MRVYEQIRTLAPDDDATRKQLIELNLRMGQTDKALIELENYITHLESQGKGELALKFLEELVRDHAEQPALKRTYAALLHRTGRTGEAISLLDGLGETLLQSGDRRGAMEVINQIVLMNPPNAEDYRTLLNQMRSRP